MEYASSRRWTTSSSGHWLLSVNLNLLFVSVSAGSQVVRVGELKTPPSPFGDRDGKTSYARLLVAR